MTATDPRSTFDAYRAAWARHDLDTIVSLHHPQGTFWLHTAGEAAVIGRDAIRAKFAGTLAMLPDIAYESLRLHWGDEFLVHELSASGTLTMAPDGGAIRFDMVDVIEFREGLLWIKNTYVECLAHRGQTPGDGHVGFDRLTEPRNRGY